MLAKDSPEKACGKHRMRRLALLLLLCFFPLLALAGETRTVIIAVIDGPRYSGTFGDPTHLYIPRIWNILRPQGVIYTEYRNLGLTETNSGHAMIVTGTIQSIANDGSQPTKLEHAGAPRRRDLYRIGEEVRGG
ncbi:MAG: sulfatase [Bacteroidetes bacterium]|nr:sulfatase [Bacteroidota bacterium]